MPATLQRMMRHQDIATTMRFYVHLEVEELAQEIYQAYARATR